MAYVHMFLYILLYPSVYISHYYWKEHMILSQIGIDLKFHAPIQYVYNHR